MENRCHWLAQVIVGEGFSLCENDNNNKRKD